MILSDYSVEEGTRHALTYQMDLYSSQPFLKKGVYRCTYGKTTKGRRNGLSYRYSQYCQYAVLREANNNCRPYQGVSTLRETGRPIRTMNMLNLPDYSKAIDFTTISRNWSARVTKLNTLSVISIGNSWNDVGKIFQGLTCFMKSGMKSGGSGYIKV